MLFNVFVKVASSKHRKYISTKKLNKMATVKSHPLPPQPRDVVGESSSEKESSDEDGDSKHEERPPTPTQSESNMFVCAWQNYYACFW